MPPVKATTTKSAKPKKPATAKAGQATAKAGQATAKAGQATAKAGQATDSSKVRVRVSAYEHKILDASVRQIMDTATRYDASVEGPIPLPTSIKKYTVNRGSFIDKNSREQFEMRVHRRLLDIINPSSKVIEALTNLNLPSGVNVDVKMM